jgi:cytochrome c oxidase cbb3-type subunit 3
MSAEKSPLDTGHEYDGIREHDNKLPNWWLAMLFLTIVFGYGYWMYYHVLRIDKTQSAEYQAELDEAAAAAVARAKSRGAVNDDSLLALVNSPSSVAQGAATFKQSCAACHGDKGQGVIGPNLTDDYWLHGAKPTDILKTIGGGVPSKGMPTWEPVLGSEGVETVTAYILTLKGKHVPGKEPQGELASNVPQAAKTANP